MDEVNASENLDVHLQSRLSPEESDQLCEMAKLACERGDWDAAQEQFEQARNRLKYIGDGVLCGRIH